MAQQSRPPLRSLPDVSASPAGCVFWLFGLSGAGKSTLAGMLAQELMAGGAGRPLLLDGDRLRSGLCAGLGFTDADRTENLRRAAQVARVGIESGLVVIATFITPRERQRRMVTEIVGEDAISFVHVDAPLRTCQQRDVKGLYAGAAAGRVPLMTGMAAEFESPARVALRLRTDRETPAVCAARLRNFACQRLQGAAA